MKRLWWSALLVALASTALFAQSGRYMGSVWNKGIDGIGGGTSYRTEVPNMIGPWGQPVEMKMPYAARPPQGEEMARAMLGQSVPLSLAVHLQQAGGGSGLRQVQCGPGGCGGPGQGLPMGPGMGMPGMGMPGMGGPNVGAGMGFGNLAPGYQMPQQGLPPGMPLQGGPLGYPGAVAAVGALVPGAGGPGAFQASRTQIRFIEPTGMRVSWYAPGVNGQAFTAEYLEAPGRYNFVQGGIYRLKLTNLPNRTNLTALYPTLEVIPATAKTATFLAHSSVPITFTEEDIDEVVNGNFLVKVVYLPDPQFQDPSATGPNVVVSTRLDPGVDPIREALRRGSIMAIIRVGNSDLEAPGTPAMDAPPPGHGQVPPGVHPGAMPGAMPGGIPGGLPAGLGLNLPPRPQQGGTLQGPPGPNLAATLPGSPQGGEMQRPYLAPSPIPGLPAAVQGSGPAPVTLPEVQPAPQQQAVPVVPNKTTTRPTTGTIVPASATSRPR